MYVKYINVKGCGDREVRMIGQNEVSYGVPSIAVPPIL